MGQRHPGGFERNHGISHEIAAEAYSLPGSFHKDPADRILTATARLAHLTLVTAADRLLRYSHVRDAGRSSVGQEVVTPSYLSHLCRYKARESQRAGVEGAAEGQECFGAGNRADSRHGGVVVGSEEFIKGLETRLGRRLGPAKRGRKKVPE